jgi:ATP adenylyltransferase/5',5'''-P-1,P-4-tetraphosphate phosphorylase II
MKPMKRKKANKMMANPTAEYESEEKVGIDQKKYLTIKFKI